METLLQLYVKMLKLHIATKTVDITFHQVSEWFYTLLFDVFHQIAEKRVDTQEDKPVDCEKAGKEAYDILEKAKDIIEDMIEESQTYGMDDLLRSHANSLETACGTARGFVEEEDEPKLGLKNK